jgi:type IV secretion system protein TrbJ
MHSPHISRTTEVHRFARMRQRAIVGVASIAFALSAPPALAGGGGFGGATEVTQLLNHAELLSSVAQQAQMVTQGIEAQIQRIQQTLMAIQNIKQVPGQLLSQAIAPYQSQLSSFQRLATTVQSLRSTASQVQSLFGRSMSEMSGLNMSPKQWLSAYASLAQQQGGSFKQQYTQDMASIQALADRAQSLQQIQASIPGVNGAVQGLQLLTQTSNVVAGEMVDLHALMARQATQDSQDRADSAQAQANGALLAQARNARMGQVIDQENQVIRNSPTFKPLIDR